MNRRGRHFTRSLAAGVAACIALAVVAGLLGTRDETDALRLDLEDLQSDAAALALVAESANARAIFDVTLRMQAHQLGERIASTTRSARNADVAPPVRDGATARGDALARVARDLADQGATELDARMREIDEAKRALHSLAASLPSD